MNESQRDDVVIGIQPISEFAPVMTSIFEEDDETRILRLKNEAQTLLEEARREADQIRAEADTILQSQNEKLATEEQEWRQKMEQAFNASQQEGYDAGFQNGLEQGQESWHEKLNEVISFIDKTKEDYYKVLQEAEPQMIELAIKTAEKIIGTKLDETPETWASIMKQLLKEAREFEEIKIYVPPEWFELTVNHREELKNMLQSTATLFIYPDETLEKDGAVLEFPFGKIDATLDIQLKEIREKLLELIEVNESER
jgi:flagellar assembly protein FliH